MLVNWGLVHCKFHSMDFTFFSQWLPIGIATGHSMRTFIDLHYSNLSKCIVPI